MEAFSCNNRDWTRSLFRSKAATLHKERTETEQYLDEPKIIGSYLESRHYYRYVFAEALNIGQRMILKEAGDDFLE